MQTTILYKYDRGDNKTTVSPIKPDCDYTEMYRLVADTDSAITDGTTICECVDTDDSSKWRDATFEEVMSYRKSMEGEQGE